MIELPHAFVFAGVASWLVAVMAMLTPNYVESMREAIRLGSATVVFLLLGTLLIFTGWYLHLAD